MSSREDSYNGVLLIMHCLITETWVLPRSVGPRTGQNIDPVAPCLSRYYLCSLCSPVSLAGCCGHRTRMARTRESIM